MTLALNLVGEVFGSLTVQQRANNSAAGKARWQCLCVCGNTVPVVGGNLRNGHTTSCGCKWLDNRKESSARYSVLYDYKHGAKLRELTWKLSEEDFDALTEGYCFYCGASPSNIHTNSWGHRFIYSGIDRVNNSLGYTRANCVSCCMVCNNMKKAMSLGDFLHHVSNIHLHQYHRAEGRVT